jgi:integrase
MSPRPGPEVLPMSEKLTKRVVDRLIAQADPAKDVLVWDSVVPGLVLRLRSGSARFAFQYKRRGRTRRVTIGAYGPLTLDQAREIARSLYAQVRGGSDPAESRRSDRAKRTTFAEVASAYIADLRERATTGVKRGKLSTAAEFERLLDRRILPALGGREVEALDLSNVQALHRSLADTPAQANRCLTVISAILGFAERHRHLRPAGGDPVAGVDLFGEKGHRERLTLAHLAKLGEALTAADGSLNASALLAIRLLALTGMRRSEVTGHMQRVRRTEAAGLRWGDVDLEARVIRLRGGKTGARVVPLGRVAVQLLAAARPADAHPEDYVCPGQKDGSPFIGIDKVRRRLYGEAGIAGRGRDLHSLRTTFSSIAADGGYSEIIVAALLGHRVADGVTARYIHPDRDPLHQAADVTSATIAAALAGQKPAEVVQIDRQKRA